MVCRGLQVDEAIRNQETNLSEAIETYDFHVLDKALADCHGMDIECKLRKKAEILHLKLEHEL